MFVGDVAAGPAGYRQVCLDRVVVSRENGTLVMSGTETGIAVRGESLTVCADLLWKRMFKLVAELDAGERPGFLPPPEYLETYVDCVTRRVLKVLTEPPSDGEDTRIRPVFWDGGLPPELNVDPTPMGRPPPF